MNRFGAAPQTNLEVVEQGYEHFNDGDIQWVLDHLDQRIVWEDARQMPDARIYRGLEEVRKFLGSFERHWEAIRFEPEQLREAGESVLAYVHLVGRGKTSGAQVDAHLVHVWDFRDLKVLRIRTFFDREEAKNAVEASA